MKIEIPFCNYVSKIEDHIFTKKPEGAIINPKR